MAQLLAERLTSAELLELGEMMDGDPRDGLLVEVEAINEKHHPEVFANGAL
jgi:hypothetical protein